MPPLPLSLHLLLYTFSSSRQPITVMGATTTQAASGCVLQGGRVFQSLIPEWLSSLISVGSV